MEKQLTGMDYSANNTFRIKFRSDNSIVFINIKKDKVKVFKGIDKKIVNLFIYNLNINEVKRIILDKSKVKDEDLSIRLKYIINELKDIEFIDETINSDVYEYKYNINDFNIYKCPFDKSLDEIYIEMTKRCNLKCNHCYIDNELLKNELSTEKILDIIDQAANMGVLRIKLTGGEPFIHRDFFKIAKYIRSKNILMRVYTNGAALNEDTINQMVECGINEVQISVDGFYEETHDSIRGKKGSLTNIKKVIPILEKMNIKTILSFTATDFNVDEIKCFEEYLKDFNNVKLNASLFMNYHNKKDCNNEMLNIADGTIDELKRCAYTMQNVWSNKMDYGFTYCSENIGYCGAGNFSMYISSIGDVYMCPVLQEEKFRLGNVNNEGLEYIWKNSEFLSEFRKYKLRDIEKCNVCERVNQCRGGCRVRAYLSNNTVYSHDPISCRMFI